MVWEYNIVSKYKKTTELCRDNGVVNASTELSFTAHSELVK